MIIFCLLNIDNLGIPEWFLSQLSLFLSRYKKINIFIQAQHHCTYAHVDGDNVGRKTLRPFRFCGELIASILPVSPGN